MNKIEQIVQLISDSDAILIGEVLTSQESACTQVRIEGIKSRLRNL